MTPAAAAAWPRRPAEARATVASPATARPLAWSSFRDRSFIPSSVIQRAQHQGGVLACLESATLASPLQNPARALASEDERVAQVIHVRDADQHRDPGRDLE